MPWYVWVLTVLISYIIAAAPALLICAALTNFFITPFSHHIGMYKEENWRYPGRDKNLCLVNNFSDMSSGMIVLCSSLWIFLLLYHIVISAGLGFLGLFRLVGYVPQVVCQCAIDHREKACEQIEEHTGLDMRTTQ